MVVTSSRSYRDQKDRESRHAPLGRRRHTASRPRTKLPTRMVDIAARRPRTEEGWRVASAKRPRSPLAKGGGGRHCQTRFERHIDVSLLSSARGRRGAEAIQKITQVRPSRPIQTRSHAGKFQLLGEFLFFSVNSRCQFNDGAPPLFLARMRSPGATAGGAACRRRRLACMQATHHSYSLI